MKNLSVYPLVLKALEFFVENPYVEVYLREFSRKLKISPNTAQRFLDGFVREGFVTEFKRGNLRYFKANLDSVVFRQIKVIFSLRKIERSGMVESLKKRGVVSLVLFGSVARGENDRESDLDLVAIGDKGNELKRIVREFEGKIGMEINLHVFTFSEWKKQKRNNVAFYQDVVAHGISLIGEIPILE